MLAVRPVALRRIAALGLLLAAVARPAWGDEDRVELALVDAHQLEPGDRPFAVSLLWTNPGESRVRFEVLGHVRALLETEAGTVPLVLDLEAGQDSGRRRLAPGAFLRLHYRGELPAHADGAVTLQLVDLAARPLVFRVVAAQKQRAEVAVWGKRASRPGRPARKAALIDRILAGLETYEPVYFVAGGDFSPVTAKFQLSAQYRVLLPQQEERAVEPGPWDDVERFFHHAYMGYTQTSVWELSSPSAPFLDTSFRPAVYYYDGDIGWPRGPWERFGLQAGFEHESNGQGGSDSRSLNIAFVRPIFTFGDESRYHFTVAPKIYAYLEKSENSDIPDYRGYVDLLLKFGKLEGFELTATLRKGTKKGYGSAQIDLTYPVALLASKLGTFLQVQYFYGYGDTLLQYDRNVHSQLRAGLMIVPYGTFFP